MTLIRILPLLLMLFGFTGVAVAVEAPPKSDASAAVAQKAAAGKIDINKADAAALQESMIGIGEMKVRIPRHPATQSTLIWPGIPRPSGHLATCSTAIRPGSRSAATQGWHC